MKIVGKYVVSHKCNGVVVSKTGFNSIVTEGKNQLLDVFFGAEAKTDLYIGLVSGSPTPVESLTDTAASHAGWTECTDYDEATRQALAVGAASSRVIASSARAVFTISAAASVYGFFVTSVSAKSATTGFLWCVAAFDSTISAIDDDEIGVEYSIEIQ